MEQKKTTVILLLLLTLLLIFSTVAIASAARITSETRECKIECTATKRAEQRSCSQQYGICRRTSSDAYHTCSRTTRNDYKSCIPTCTDSTCRRDCSDIYRQERKSCDLTTSRRACTQELRDCRQVANDANNQCRDQCANPNQINEQPTEEEEIEESTEEPDYTIDKQTCQDAGGHYQQLCKGPYFGIRCSQHKYCQCGGINEYSCPNNYNCDLDFTPPVVRSGIQGWKNLLGMSLGDIGICENYKYKLSTFF